MDHIYPDDVLYYQEVINKRHNLDYLMDLAIAHNPHSENPEELFNTLQMEAGESYLNNVEPDRPAIQNLQGLISPNMQK